MPEGDDLGWPGLTGEEARTARTTFERYIEIALRVATRLHERKVDTASKPNTMTERSSQNQSV